MTRRYENRTAVITGGAGGIGLAAAVRLANEGASVILVDASQALLEKAATQLRARGCSVHLFSCDVTNEQELAELPAFALQHTGSLDVLVHCAGIVGPTNVNVLDYKAADFRRVLDVNLTGAFLACKLLAPTMVERGYGRILLLASMAGKDGNPGMAGYVASKAGVIGLAKAMGKELAKTGVTVNALTPAVIATPMNRDTSPETLALLTSKIPMERLGAPEEAAAIIAWICSHESSFNTGAVFDLSGGRATY